MRVIRVGWAVLACRLHPRLRTCHCEAANRRFGPISDIALEMKEAAKKRLHRNVLAIALANKLARIAWGVLAGSRTFEASKLQVA